MAKILTCPPRPPEFPHARQRQPDDLAAWGSSLTWQNGKASSESARSPRHAAICESGPVVDRTRRRRPHRALPGDGAKSESSGPFPGLRVASYCRLTLRMIRREAVGVDAVVSGHVREIANNKDAAHGEPPQR